MARSAPLTLYFEPFHISSDVDLLYLNEQVVPLEPLAVRVLRYLAKHHQRVISKEELLEKIWPDTFTTDGVLKKAISQARRALGDHAEESRYIKTYHARGYRFIAAVRIVYGDDLSETGRGADHPGEDSDVLEAALRALKLLNRMCEQIDAGDSLRRLTATQARREIVRGIQAILIKHECDEEAYTVAEQWLLEELFSGSARD
jgi:DNA-binding winged helix-turn-helix (wHTH) protein